MNKTILSFTLLTAAVSTSMLAAPSTANAGDCGSVASVTSDLWSKYGQLASNLPYADKVDEMIKFWNQMAGNSWAHIGPRRLDYGTNLAGTVVGPTDRVFIAAAPTNKSSVEVKINKLDGKAKTSVTVCKVDAAGNKVKLWDFTADNGNYTKTWTKTVSGMQDQILTVHLHGHSATNKFKYTVRATKK